MQNNKADKTCQKKKKKGEPASSTLTRRNNITHTLKMIQI